jgi:hypothetical protein
VAVGHELGNAAACSTKTPVDGVALPNMPNNLCYSRAGNCTQANVQAAINSNNAQISKPDPDFLINVHLHPNDPCDMRFSDVDWGLGDRMGGPVVIGDVAGNMAIYFSGMGHTQFGAELCQGCAK